MMSIEQRRGKMKTTRLTTFAVVTLASALASAAPTNYSGTLNTNPHIIGVRSGSIVLCDTVADTVTHTFEASSTLSDDVSASLGSNDNTVEVIIANATECGVTMTPMTFGGNVLTINGQGGADVLIGGDGETVLLGGSGGDDLTVRKALGYADGEADRDRVRSDFTAGGEFLAGNAGNDCLQQIQESAAPNSSGFLCDDDQTEDNSFAFDRYNAPFGGLPATHYCDVALDSSTNCAYPVNYSEE
jgi:Ca2+-binding RTX toxin-like protein